MLNQTIEMETSDGRQFNLVPYGNHLGTGASLYFVVTDPITLHDHCLNGWWKGKQVVIEPWGTLPRCPESVSDLELLLTYWEAY